MKRLFCVLTVLCLLLTMAPIPARAETVKPHAKQKLGNGSMGTHAGSAEPAYSVMDSVVASGICGADVRWTLTADGTLTISGTGAMEDYDADYPDWDYYAETLKRVVFEGEVTHIGAYAFWDYTNIKEMTLPESLRTIGYAAVADCSGLREIVIPAGVRTLGDYAFAGCTGLDTIVFRGSAPTFGAGVFENVEAMASYPAGDPSWNDSTRLDYGGQISWITGENLVRLELASPPACTGCAVGDDVDLSGIQVKAFCKDGSSMLLPDSMLTLESADTTTVGVHTAVASFMGLTVEFPIYVHAGRKTVALDPARWPESSHDYGCDLDDSQYISYSGADSLTLTFSAETYLEYGYDFLYVYDGDGNELGRFTGGQAAGVTVTVPGSSARIRLTSDYSYTEYGYALSAATASVLEHVGEAVDGKEPDCVSDGAIGGIICDICGEACGGERIPALGHDWGAWQSVPGSNDMYRVCSRCGVREDRPYVRTFTDAGDSEYADMTLSQIRALYEAVDWEMEAEYAVQPNTSAPYAPGRLTDDALDNLTAQVNFIRRLAGLDSVRWNEGLVAYTQAGTLVNAVNDVLSHYPVQPAGMADDLYQTGYYGTSHSNLAWGTHMGMMDSVLGYLDDSDSSNIAAVGHRRWLLNPGMGLTGFGVTGAGSWSHYHAMYAFDSSNAGNTDADFVAYPGGSGIYPRELMGSHVAWSVQLMPGTFLAPDYKAVQVTLTRQSDGKRWEFSNQQNSGAGYFNVDTVGYGDSYAVIFRPAGVSAYEGAYHVRIMGLQTRDGEAVAIEYTVDFRSVYDTEEPTEPEDPTEPEEPTEPGFEPTCGTTDAQIYEILIGLKEEYPEGMTWTNDNSYRWNINNTVGYGCAAFSFILSDAAFGYLPSRTIYDDITIDDLRAGDILRINDDTHSVVVLEVHEDYVVLAEGNYNNSIHWGRIYSAAEIAANTDYVITRYPEHHFADGVCTECGAQDPDDVPEPAAAYGDVNGDGNINSLDLVILRQYLAGWEVEVQADTADANGDGRVNSLDLVVLRQYLAGWDVTLGPNT